MNQTVLIVGASARAAAFSAARAGYQPRAADLFCDVDLARRFPTVKIGDYERDLPGVLAESDTDYWMYTGGLENYPDLVDQLADEKPLLGNAGWPLREIRDPFRLATALQSGGHCYPQFGNSFDAVESDFVVKKPRKSIGGSRVELLDRHPSGGEFPSGNSVSWYYQQLIDGVPLSAVYCGCRGETVLIGWTRQLIGQAWLGGTAFQYCGSIGPFDADLDIAKEAMRIGNCLARFFDLSGLFGVDFVFDGERLWTVEVNPRYTASVEVVEKAFGVQVIDLHCCVCSMNSGASFVGNSILKPTGDPPIPNGKGILFARSSSVITDPFEDWCLARSHDHHAFQVADIPKAGTEIRQGAPIATVFANGSDLADVEYQLRCTSQEAFALLDNDR